MIKYLLIFMVCLIGMNVHSQTLLSFDERSSIRIDGYSNVKDFECEYTGRIPKLSLRYEHVDGTILVRGGNINIPVINLDCGNSRMNDDMMDMLREDEHPPITFTIESISLGKSVGTANTIITIAGVSRRHTIQFNVGSEGETITAVAKKELSLTQFGIEPPTALFGLIRVKDKIVVNFDVRFKLGN